MTNEEVNQFFIDNGLIKPIKIVNSPIFTEFYLDENNNSYFSTSPNTFSTSNFTTRTYKVSAITFPNIYSLIRVINHSPDKWYIYNDYKTYFNLDMNHIYSTHSVNDDILALRLEKIKRIRKRIYDK